MIHRLHKHSGQRQQSTATVVTSTTSTGAPLSGKGRIIASEIGDTRAIHAPFGVGDARLVAAPSSAPTGLLAEGHQYDDGETSAIHSSPVRHERRWRKSRRVLVKMVCVTLAGTLVETAATYCCFVVERYRSRLSLPFFFMTYHTGEDCTDVVWISPHPPSIVSAATA